jgi:hypothetical protein
MPAGGAGRILSPGGRLAQMAGPTKESVSLSYLFKFLRNIMALKSSVKQIYLMDFYNFLLYSTEGSVCEFEVISLKK